VGVVEENGQRESRLGGGLEAGAHACNRRQFHLI
jgi:hypothetical protein